MARRLAKISQLLGSKTAAIWPCMGNNSSNSYKRKGRPVLEAQECVPLQRVCQEPAAAVALASLLRDNNSMNNNSKNRIGRPVLEAQEGVAP